MTGAADRSVPSRRKLIAIEFVSLDGVVQAPGRHDEDTSGGFTHGGWIRPYSDPELASLIHDQMNLPFELLSGRTTFEIWAPYWPHHAATDPISTCTEARTSCRRSSGAIWSTRCG